MILVVMITLSHRNVMAVKFVSLLKDQTRVYYANIPSAIDIAFITGQMSFQIERHTRKIIVFKAE